MSKHWILHITIQIILLYALIQIYLISKDDLFTSYINTISYTSTKLLSNICFGILGYIEYIILE